MILFGKLQTTVVEDQTWGKHELNMNEVTNLKSWGFHGKSSKFTLIFYKFFYPPISAIVRFVVDGVSKLVFVSVVVEADGWHAPAL